jgi:hypothetical protein
MANYPTFKLYDVLGTTLIYEFECVTNITPGILEDDTVSFVQHNSLRSNGSITKKGGKQAYEITIDFYLKAQGNTDAEKYDSLIVQEKAIRSAIATDTRYILKIDTSSTTTEDIKVKRFFDVEFPIPTSGQKKVNSSRGTIRFLARCWN